MENRATGPMELSQFSDEDLMERIQAGERPAFAELVRRHTQRFYRLAFRMMMARDDAEDIVQSAFLKLWQDPKKWKGSKNVKFSTWFYRVVVNLCLDAKKKKQPERFEGDWPEHVAAQGNSMETQLIQKDQHQWLEQSMAELPPRQQVALNLCFYEGLSNREAADVMGIGLKALESLMIRAKQHLKDKAKQIRQEV